MATKKPTDHFDNEPFDSEGWEIVHGEFGEIRDPKDSPVMGIYLGSRTVELKDKETGEDTQTTAHDFLDMENQDEKFTVWSTKDIDDKLEKIPAESKVRIEFIETVPLGGGRTFSRFKVYHRK